MTKLYFTEMEIIQDLTNIYIYNEKYNKIYIRLEWKSSSSMPVV